MTDRQILINLIASMGLCDHMGDVADDCWQALGQIGITPPSGVSDLSELMAWLARDYGAESVFGTKLTDDPA